MFNRPDMPAVFVAQKWQKGHTVVQANPYVLPHLHCACAAVNKDGSEMSHSVTTFVIIISEKTVCLTQTILKTVGKNS